EFNVRMGDPETQAVLPVIHDQLPALLDCAARGGLGALRNEPWIEPVADDFLRLRTDRAAVCVVLASKGYPGEFEDGLPLAGLDDWTAGLERDQYVFHAGTKRAGDGWVSKGGRVLNVVTVAESVSAAR